MGRSQFLHGIPSHPLLAMLREYIMYGLLVVSLLLMTHHFVVLVANGRVLVDYLLHMLVKPSFN